MPRLQYTPYTKSSGYRAQKVDDKNIARIREEGQRTLAGMQRYAEEDIKNRQELLRQTKEEQADQKEAQAKNFEIQTQNSRNELQGLLAEGDRIKQQYNADVKAREEFYKGLNQFSSIAGGIVKDLQEQKEKEDFDEEANKAADPKNVISQRLQEHNLVNLDLNQITALEEARAKGENPRLISKLGAESEAQTYWATKGALAHYGKFFYAKDHQAYINNIEQKLGRSLNSDEAIYYTGLFRKSITESVRQKDLGHKLLYNTIKYLDAHDTAYFQRVGERETKDNQSIITNKALKILVEADSDDLRLVWPAQWRRLAGIHDREKAWELVTNSVFLARDASTGKYYRELDEIGNLPIFSDETKEGEEGIPFKTKFEKTRWQDLQRKRNALDLQHRRQLQQADDIAFNEDADEALQALGPNPSESQLQEAIDTLWEKHRRVDPRLTSTAKKFTIEAKQRESEVARILALPDYELTTDLVESVKTNGTTTEYQSAKQRFDTINNTERSKKTTETISRGLTKITGTTSFGTSKKGDPGAGIALMHFEKTVLEETRLAVAGGANWDLALIDAVNRNSQLYDSTYTVPGSLYERKITKNGITYPQLEKLYGGRLKPADEALRSSAQLKVTVKQAGSYEEAVRIPNLFMTNERMDYVVRNFSKPGGIKLTPEELTMRSMFPNVPMHEIFNAGLAASGRSERLSSPLPPLGAAQQKIINDPDASMVSRMNAMNVGMGNTEIYRRPSAVRAGSPLKRSFTGALTYSDNKQAYIDAGKSFEDILGFTVTEHPDFGGVAPGVHSSKSYHGYGEAFDVILERGTRAEDIQNIGRLKELIRRMDLFEEIIGPGDGDPDHESHLHLGGLKRPITPQDIKTLKSFWGR